MKIQSLLLPCSFLLLTSFASAAAIGIDDGRQAEFARDFDPRSFGAAGDGVAKDTVALQRTIDAAGEKGGRVVIGGGTFLTGSLFLRSGVEIHLAADGRRPCRKLSPPLVRERHPPRLGQRRDDPRRDVPQSDDP